MRSRDEIGKQRQRHTDASQHITKISDLERGSSWRYKRDVRGDSVDTLDLLLSLLGQAVPDDAVQRQEKAQGTVNERAKSHGEYT